MSDNRTIESYINTCYLRFYRKPSVFERLITELVKNNSVDGNNNNNIINNINNVNNSGLSNPVNNVNICDSSDDSSNDDGVNNETIIFDEYVDVDCTLQSEVNDTIRHNDCDTELVDMTSAEEISVGKIEIYDNNIYDNSEHYSYLTDEFLPCTTTEKGNEANIFIKN